jgi:hypothetical protein
MDFHFTAAEEAFRADIRTWLRDNLPKGWDTDLREPEDEAERFAFRLDWERHLHAGG